jgi:hypothetical protein
MIGVSDARLKCADSNHRWADVPFYVVPNTRFPGVGKNIWRREQHCERRGCERIRVMVASPRTREVISTHYGGRIEKVGSVTRRQLRTELILRQKRQGKITEA